MKKLLFFLATTLPLHAQSFYLATGITFVRGVVSVETTSPTSASATAASPPSPTASTKSKAAQTFSTGPPSPPRQASRLSASSRKLKPATTPAPKASRNVSFVLSPVANAKNNYENELLGKNVFDSNALSLVLFSTSEITVCIEKIMNTRFAYFSAGDEGLWGVRYIREIIGQGLPSAHRVDVSSVPHSRNKEWLLKGIRSNERYTTTEEKQQLTSIQEDLGRADSTFAVLIPIKKTDAWWQLSQDRRREIFQEHSKHNSIGMKYLPAIARRLYHCRDLETVEPFDFLTWFEFHPSEESAFDELLGELRSSLEWTYVEREVEVRLQR